MDVLAGLLSSYGPLWIPASAIIAVVGLVVFYARGGRGAQNERLARKRE